MPITFPQTRPRHLPDCRRPRSRHDARHGALRLSTDGADVIELGVPFSDPLADGPVIQRASERAVARGTRLSDVLDCIARDIRARRARPAASSLFSYLNPVVRMGMKQFCAGRERRTAPTASCSPT